MKKISIFGLLMLGSALVITSCNQEPKFPTDEELTQKVADKYGAELNNLKELRAMECETSMSDKVSAKLSEVAPAQ